MNTKKRIYTGVELLITMLGEALLITILFVPINGYYSPVKKEETDLMPIYVDDETGEEIYAVKADSGEYIIKYRDKNNETITDIIACEVMEEKSRTVPIKRTYEYKAKSGIGGLGISMKEHRKVLILSNKNIR